SIDHGQTWTDPVRPNGQVSWTDKPEIATSPSGQDVYVSWNGPTGGDLWVGVSHDYGATWKQIRVVTGRRYFYAYDGIVLPDGTVMFSESSFRYTCAGSGSFNCVSSGQVWHHAVISRDNGDTWENVIVAKVPIGKTASRSDAASSTRDRRRSRPTRTDAPCSPTRGRSPTAVPRRAT